MRMRMYVNPMELEEICERTWSSHNENTESTGFCRMAQYWPDFLDRSQVSNLLPVPKAPLCQRSATLGGS